MNQIPEVDVKDFITENYFTYGNEVNFNRALVGVDGLKPVQRRMLMALNEVAKGKLTGSVNAIGATQVYHPYGDKSIEDVLAHAARRGMIDSHGDFGLKLMETIPAAAPRYTKVGFMGNRASAYFSLSEYAPKVEGPEKMEPSFLVFPVPFAMIYGNFSWGLGTIGRNPAFTYESLVEAYEKDDPMQLDSNFGYKINYKDSELNDLWEKGFGRLSLSHKVTRPNDDTVLITGSGELFTPNLNLFNHWIEDGQIIIHNESKKGIVLRIQRIKGARKVNMEEVFEAAKRASTKSRYYEIKLVLNGVITRLGIKDWLSVTMTNYQNCFDQNKEDRINRLKRQIEIYKVLPEVGKMVIDNIPNEEIAKKMKIDIDLVKAVCSKPISTLRRESFEQEIKRCEEQITAVGNEECDKLIHSFYGMFDPKKD